MGAIEKIKRRIIRRRCRRLLRRMMLKNPKECAFSWLVNNVLFIEAGIVVEDMYRLTEGQLEYLGIRRLSDLVPSAPGPEKEA